MATTTIDAWDELAAADPGLADELVERVARGAELLDAKAPGWAARVDLDCLAMQWCDACILGQVYGEYEAGAAELGIEGEGRDYGFAGTDGAGQEFWDREYAALGALWRRQVRSRLAAAGEVALG